MKIKLISMRIILTILVAAALSPRLQSQSLVAGVRGGLNLAQWKQNIQINSVVTGPVSNSLTTEARVGSLVGLYYTLMFSEKIGLQQELFYHSVGMRSGSYQFSVRYVSLPIFFRYNITHQWHLLGGPQIGYFISAAGQQPSPGGVGMPNMEDNIKPIDLNTVFGIGVDLNRLNLGLRYSIGLTNILKNTTTQLPGLSMEQEVFNVGWQFVAGYRLVGKSVAAKE